MPEQKLCDYILKGPNPTQWQQIPMLDNSILVKLERDALPIKKANYHVRECLGIHSSLHVFNKHIDGIERKNMFLANTTCGNIDNQQRTCDQRQ